ncbi:hypothetical protein GCM10007079_05370 [Nocardiopsis terrae]|nr:hypothetical protein GCM10007079_05370 [Nocardiopsis terrae]
MHEDVALDQAKDWLKDPEGQKALINIFEGFMEGRWSQEYIRAIGQDYRLEPRQWPIEQICSFALMHSYLMEGILRSVQIGVGETPSGDRYRVENSDALSNLPRPFRATVDLNQRNGDQDGWLEWDEPIYVERSTGVAYFLCPEDVPGPLYLVEKAKPGRVPLEIGTTKASRSVLHVIQDAGVARWPYESERIHLFVSRKFPWRPFSLF